jgi:hypothetical protein
LGNARSREPGPWPTPKQYQRLRPGPFSNSLLLSGHGPRPGSGRDQADSTQLDLLHEGALRACEWGRRQKGCVTGSGALSDSGSRSSSGPLCLQLLLLRLRALQGQDQGHAHHLIKHKDAQDGGAGSRGPGLLESGGRGGAVVGDGGRLPAKHLPSTAEAPFRNIPHRPPKR